MREIGDNIDQLLDIKLMVIRRMEANPALANEIFQAVGRQELKFIVNFGFWFGLMLGIPTAIITEVLFPGTWWLLPILGVIIGYVTNLLAIVMIFEPPEPRRILGFRAHGLFLRRQDEVADVYAGIIADEIVTVANIGEELLHGPKSDRTRQLIETSMGPAVDQATGPLQPMVRVAMGTREYDAIRESVAAEAVDYTITPMNDPEFNRRQGVAIRTLVAARMREMPPKDFTEMLRTTIKEDRWLVYPPAAGLGFGGGLPPTARRLAPPPPSSTWRDWDEREGGRPLVRPPRLRRVPAHGRVGDP